MALPSETTHDIAMPYVQSLIEIRIWLQSAKMKLFCLFLPKKAKSHFQKIGQVLCDIICDDRW